MHSQPSAQRRTLAMPRNRGDASAPYLFMAGASYGEGDRFLDDGCDRRANPPTFFFDNNDASNRTRLLTNSQLAIGIAEQGSF
jgi:hypothetical protein